MYNAGVAVAARYLDSPNILWHVMFDQGDTPASTRGIRVNAFFDGVNDTEGASTRPVRWIEQANGATTVGQGWYLTRRLPMLDQLVSTAMTTTPSSASRLAGPARPGPPVTVNRRTSAPPTTRGSPLNNSGNAITPCSSKVAASSTSATRTGRRSLLRRSTAPASNGTRCSRLDLGPGVDALLDVHRRTLQGHHLWAGVDVRYHW